MREQHRDDQRPTPARAAQRMHRECRRELAVPWRARS
jgi:hypothetical protein